MSGLLGQDERFYNAKLLHTIKHTQTCNYMHMYSTAQHCQTPHHTARHIEPFTGTIAIQVNIILFFFFLFGPLRKIGAFVWWLRNCDIMLVSSLSSHSMFHTTYVHILFYCQAWNKNYLMWFFFSQFTLFNNAQCSPRKNYY